MVYAVWTFLGIVVTTLGTIAVQAFKARSERPTTGGATAPTTVDVATVTKHAERLAVVEHRADDNDDRDDLQDRSLAGLDDRLDALERFHDHRDPGWRLP